MTVQSASPGQVYEERLRQRELLFTAEAARSRRVSLLRLLVVALFLGALGWTVWRNGGTWGNLLLSALGALFVALVVAHAGIVRREVRAHAAMLFYRDGLRRLGDTWKDAASSHTVELPPNHPFVFDLDIVGRGSLLDLVDTTTTPFGFRHLLARLSANSVELPAQLEARQDAVRDLASRPDFREALHVGGRLAEEEPVLPPEGFLRWAEAGGSKGVPSYWALPALFLSAATLTTMVFYRALPPWTWVGALLFQQLTAFAALRRAGAIVQQVQATEGQFARYGDLLAAIENEPFASARLRELASSLKGVGLSATEEMRALSRIVRFVDARNNEVFRLFLVPLLLWDIHCALQLQKWQARAGKHVRDWLETLGEIEAASALGTFAFEHPHFAWPRFSVDPVFCGRGIAHPLLARGVRVANDVPDLASGHALVVTGSNMSGKSTLLRSIGMAGVLAYAGAPVCAQELTLGSMRMATSMRIADSLGEGVSRFFAELLKLRATLDLATLGPTLFLLDEILSGTNHRERLIGARSFVSDLLDRGALGLVSTHDLALGELERDRPGKVKNVHFEEQVQGEAMSFDYRMRPGLVQSSNALRLMRNLRLVPESVET